MLVWATVWTDLAVSLPPFPFALAIGKESAYVNWERKLIDADNFNVVPFIENNYTYVPVRFMAEILRELGAEVKNCGDGIWEIQAKKIYILEMYIFCFNYLKNHFQFHFFSFFP